MGSGGCKDDRIGRFCGEFWRGYTLELHNRLNYSRLEYLLFVVAGVVGGYALSMLTGGVPPSMPLHDRVLVWAKLVWLLYLPIALLSGIAILLYNPWEDFHLERRRQTGDYLVIFQVTTRGFNKEAVERGVRSVLYWAPKYLRNYEIWVVTEDDVDKGFFEGLKRLSDRVRVVYVPRDYRTPNNTRYKARALNYAMELREKLGYSPEKTWIYLMDEESIVGEDTVLGIIDFIENEAPKGKLVGQGLIVYSNYWGRNLLTSLEDSLRATDDITKFRLQNKIGRNYFGLHGSHLLYKFSIERIIGWDIGHVRIEDTAFAFLIDSYLSESKPFGWLKGKLYEQSPFTISDIIKQRRRWIYGIIDVLISKRYKIKYKLIKLIFLLYWLLGFPSTLLFFITLIHPTPIPEPSKYTGPLLGFIFINWIFYYWEGSKLNIKIIKNIIFIRILNILLIPIISVIEGIPPWIALLTYNKNKNKFDIIKK